MTSNHRHGSTGKYALAGDIDKAKSPTVHTHPDIAARLDAIEKEAAVTKALLLAAIGGGSFNPPVYTVPDAPTGVSAIAGDASANVSWTAPASNGGASITNYQVTPYVGASAQTAVYTGSASTAKTVSGLTNGTAYTFKVAAINAAGTGAQSSASGSVTPAASSRPFAAPTTTGTWTVPSSITHNGSADVSAALNSWISGTVPDGAIIDFAISGAVYRLDAGLDLNDRHNLVLEGHGTTTLAMVTDANDYWQSAFVVRNGTSHIAIGGFIVDGTYAWGSTPTPYENPAVLCSVGWYGNAPTSYIEMERVTASGIYGDGAYIEGRNTDGAPSSHFWIYANSFDGLGRNGISLINCTDVLVENNTFDHVAYHAFDFEPVQAIEVITDVTIRDNAVGSYAHRSGLIGYFLAGGGLGVASIMSHISVTDNTCVGIAANGYDGSPRALHVGFSGLSAGHAHTIAFTGNSTARSVSTYGCIYFNWVDGLTVTGNTQPYTGSLLVLASNCTSATTSPNP